VSCEADDVHFLGEVSLQQGELDQAEQLFDRAVGHHRESHFVYVEAEDVHYLGDVYVRRDKLEEGHASFERIIELYPHADSVQDVNRYREAYEGLLTSWKYK
ncbi:hypothetical protein H0H87_008022, partial [Tephrocybe sp. NHM501043]